jgi:adenylylsulfate kinase
VGDRLKILVMGLPGSGKTTLARRLVPLLSPCVHFNADEVRKNVHADLTFDPEDRIEHARRLGWWASTVARSGMDVIADFICPLPETRKAFGADYTIWLDTIRASVFDDTNALFVPPDCLTRITDWSQIEDVRWLAAEINRWR